MKLHLHTGSDSETIARAIGTGVRVETIGGSEYFVKLASTFLARREESVFWLHPLQFSAREWAAVQERVRKLGNLANV